MDSTELARFTRVRERTRALCAPLTVEDHQVQPMPDASPVKWHLAHTTWFFEALVLGAEGADAFDPSFAFLFNSYYEALGARVERARRGMLTRPSLAQVHAYRDAIDRRLGAAIVEGRLDHEQLARLELGLHHEQQHQELILTDLKYTLGTQPLAPAYRADLTRTPGEPGTPCELGWRTFDGGVVSIGAPAEGFAFDNERPRHRTLVAPFALANRPITNAEVSAFIADGGYREPRLWLSDGWAVVQTERWEAPLYWRRDSLYDLAGERAIDPAEIACHLSFYEADAIARWLGARLPTEAEWELAATGDPEIGNYADDDRLHPGAPISFASGAGTFASGAGTFACGAGTFASGAGTFASGAGTFADHMFGDVWEWTASAYSPYPKFRPLAGALAEYNGKFMSGQQVLRGGSCLSPRGHLRASYRNFFPPGARWQMTGARLARDVEAS